MKQSNVIFLTAVIVLFACSGARALTIMPSVDATIFDGAGINPKDGVPDYINLTGCPQALNYAGFESRGIIEFSLSGVPAIFSSASLHLNVEAALGPYPFQLDSYYYAGDLAVTYGDFGAGALFASPGYSGQTSLDLDVTSAITTLLSGGKTSAGFNFRMPDIVSQDGTPAYVAFNSLEYPVAATLVIEEAQGGGSPGAVPEPATLLLFAGGALGMARGRR